MQPERDTHSRSTTTTSSSSSSPPSITTTPWMDLHLRTPVPSKQRYSVISTSTTLYTLTGDEEDCGRDDERRTGRRKTSGILVSDDAADYEDDGSGGGNGLSDTPSNATMVQSRSKYSSKTSSTLHGSPATATSRRRGDRSLDEIDAVIRGIDTRRQHAAHARRQRSLSSTSSSSSSSSTASTKGKEVDHREYSTGIEDRRRSRRRIYPHEDGEGIRDLASGDSETLDGQIASIDHQGEDHLDQLIRMSSQMLRISREMLDSTKRISVIDAAGRQNPATQEVDMRRHLEALETQERYMSLISNDAHEILHPTPGATLSNPLYRGPHRLRTRPSSSDTSALYVHTINVNANRGDGSVAGASSMSVDNAAFSPDPAAPKNVDGHLHQTPATSSSVSALKALQQSTGGRPARSSKEPSSLHKKSISSLLGSSTLASSLPSACAAPPSATSSSSATSTFLSSLWSKSSSPSSVSTAVTETSEGQTPAASVARDDSSSPASNPSMAPDADDNAKVRSLHRTDAQSLLASIVTTSTPHTSPVARGGADESEHLDHENDHLHRDSRSTTPTHRGGHHRHRHTGSPSPSLSPDLGVPSSKGRSTLFARGTINDRRASSPLQQAQAAVLDLASAAASRPTTVPRVDATFEQDEDDIVTPLQRKPDKGGRPAAQKSPRHRTSLSESLLRSTVMSWATASGTAKASLPSVVR